VEAGCLVGVTVIAAGDGRDGLAAGEELVEPGRPEAHIIIVYRVIGTKADVDEIVPARGQHLLDAVKEGESLKILIVAFAVDVRGRLAAD
jgi:hypothetical protein